MEKLELIRLLMVDEPSYTEIAVKLDNPEIILEILPDTEEELKNRIVSLCPYLVGFDPVTLLHSVYFSGGPSNKAVVVATLKLIDRIYLDDPKVKEIIKDALRGNNPGALKFALKTVAGLGLAEYRPLIEALEFAAEDSYFTGLVKDTLATL